MKREQRPAVDFSVAEAQPFLLEGGEHGVLLLHGFTGSAGHMRPLGEALYMRGFTVQGINLPGHASSMEDMAKSDWTMWLQAAKEALLALSKRCRYVSVAGLSMGGVLSLLLAQQMRVCAVAPISAPMAVQNKAMPFARVASIFIKTIMWNGSEERLKQLDQRYDLGYPGFPTRCAADLSHLIRMARKNLSAVTCPLLAVQSHADETISPDSADVILNGVSSETKGVLWLENVPHVCTISIECERIAEAITALLREAEKTAS